MSLPAWMEIYRCDATNNAYFQASGVRGTVTAIDSAFTPDKNFWRLVVERP